MGRSNENGQNRVGKSDGFIAHKVFYGKKVTFRNFKIFGTPAMAHISTKEMGRSAEVLYFTRLMIR